jgi:hypothetical protein
LTIPRLRKVYSLAAAFALVLGALCGLAVHIAGRDLHVRHVDAVRAAVGTFHIHSEMSHDSPLSLAEIVAAARACHLDFVVLTDHNEQYAGPMIRHGVVVLSSAELSTPYGHVIALGARRVLNREQRGAPSLYKEIRAVGGWPVIAHPADPKLPWTGPWAGAAGLEIANFASSTRRRGGIVFLGLAPLLATGLLNRDLALAQVYDRDTTALERWDKDPDPAFVGLCGVDAHGWIRLEDNLRLWTLVLDGPMPEAESARAAWVLSELVSGRAYCSAGLFGPPPGLSLEARRAGARVAAPGPTATVAQADELVARIEMARAGESLVLFRNGLAVDRTEAKELRYPAPSAGTYRVELWRAVPDIVWGQHLTPVAYSGRLRLTGDDTRAGAPASTLSQPSAERRP